MATISGDLKLVTEVGSRATEVWVRAPRVRTTAGAVITTSQDIVQVTDGHIEFVCSPGAAVLTVVVDGRPVEHIPLIVSDGASMTLVDAVNAGLAADGAERSALEDLAKRVADAVLNTESAVGTALQHVESARAEAGKAAQSATTAGQQAATAKQHADAANASKNAAAGSANTAKQHADAASQSASGAAQSATTAGQHKDAALGAVNTAQQHANTAKGHADAANASKNAAAGSVSTAKQHADAASASKDAAAGSASTAKSEADRAKQQADAAAETASSGVPDATATVKGKLRLAGDLGGTADTPTVPKLAEKADKDHKHTTADIDGLQEALAQAQSSNIKTLTTENLDDVVKQDTYHQPANREATTDRNYPINQAGLLEVHTSDAFIYQRYTVYGSNTASKLFVRGKYRQTWGAWVRIPIDADLNGKLNTADAVVGVTGGKVVRRDNSGNIAVPESTPNVGTAATSKKYVDDQLASKADAAALASKADVGHKHSMGDIEGMTDLIRGKAPVSHTHTSSAITDSTWDAGKASAAGKLIKGSDNDGAIFYYRDPQTSLEVTRKSYVDRVVNARPALWVWDGNGTWSAPAAASSVDYVLNTKTSEIFNVRST